MNAYNQDYTVTITKEFPDGEMCTEEATVEVRTNSADFTATFSHEIGYCETTVNCTLEVPENSQVEDYRLRIKDLISGEEVITGGVFEGENLIKFSYPFRRNADSEQSLVANVEGDGTSLVFTADCNDLISDPISIPPSPFVRTWLVASVNGFTPNGDGNNDTYSQLTRSFNDECNYVYPSSLISLRMEIWNRWGTQILWSKELEADPLDIVGVDGKDVAWDGANAINNSYYVVKVKIETCGGVEVSCETLLNTNFDCAHPGQKCVWPDPNNTDNEVTTEWDWHVIPVI